MVEQIKNGFSKRTILVMILLSISLLSNLVVSKIVTKPDFNISTIESLNDKQVTVMKLATTAAASSTLLSLIPGDAATPIANQIAELSPYFILILGSILLEKMLVAVVGYVSFKFIIPFACGLGIFYLFTKKEVIRNMAIKLAIFGIVLFMAIPTSIKVSDLMYNSYQTSIENTFEKVEENEKYIEEKKEDISKEDKNWVDKVGEYLSNLTSKIGSDIQSMVRKGEDTLVSFIDAISVMIITSCVIPLVVIGIFGWIIKILFGFDAITIARRYKKNEPEEINLQNTVVKDIISQDYQNKDN